MEKMNYSRVSGRPSSRRKSNSFKHPKNVEMKRKMNPKHSSDLNGTMNMSRHKNASKTLSGIRLESSFLKPIEPQSILGRSRPFRPMQRNTSVVNLNAPGHYLNSSRSLLSSNQQNQRQQHGLYEVQLKIKQLEEQMYQQQQMQRCYSSRPPVYSQTAGSVISGPTYNPGPLNHNYSFMLNPNASIIESFNLNVLPPRNFQWPMQSNFNMARSVSGYSKSMRPSFMDLQNTLIEGKMLEFFETIRQLKETKYLDPLEKMLVLEQFLTIIENEHTHWMQRSEQARMDEEIHCQQQNHNLERVQTWMESSAKECGNVAPPVALAPSSVPLVASGVPESTVRTGQRSRNQGNVYEESLHEAIAYEESIHEASASQAEGDFQDLSQSEESDEPVAEEVVRRGTFCLRDWTILKGDGPTDLKITGILINMLTRKMVENCHKSDNIVEVTKSNLVKTKLCNYILNGKFQNPGNAVPPEIANHFSGGRFPEQWRKLAKKWSDTERNAVVKTKKIVKTKTIENPGILSTPVSSRRKINMNSSVLTRSMVKKQKQASLGLFGMQF